MGSNYSFDIDPNAKTRLDTMNLGDLLMLLGKFSDHFARKECFTVDIEYFPAVWDELINDHKLMTEYALGGDTERPLDLNTRGHLVMRVMNMWLANGRLTFTCQGRLKFNPNPPS